MLDPIRIFQTALPFNFLKSYDFESNFKVIVCMSMRRECTRSVSTSVLLYTHAAQAITGPLQQLPHKCAYSFGLYSPHRVLCGHYA